MPENDVPSTKPDPGVAPGEFDFVAPVTERPRVKRRVLQQASPTKPAEHPPEKVIEAETRPVASTAKSAPATSSARPSSSTPTPTQSAAAKPKTATQPASPHGTRPATLYYSSGSRPDKATTSPASSVSPTSPMKTTPSASPSPSTSASSTTTPRSTAAATRPSSPIDYRSNVDRQTREQQSVGGILTILVYALIFLFVSGACLATYGMYIITKQLNQQSVTMSDFDKRYSTDYKDVNSRLVTTMDNLTQAQAQIARQQDLITKQQDALNKLLAAMDDNTAAIRQERVTRAQETANLRSRLKDVEYQGPTTRKY